MAIRPNQPTPIEDDFVNLILPSLIAVALTRESISKAIASDPALKILAESIERGNLANNRRVIKSFKKVFGELCTSSDGIILRGERILVPDSLQANSVDLAHEGYLGVVKTKRLLRS